MSHSSLVLVHTKGHACYALFTEELPTLWAVVLEVHCLALIHIKDSTQHEIIVRR